MQAIASHWHENIVETAAEADENMMEAYLENSTLSQEQIIEGIRAQVLANQVVPVFCGSACCTIHAIASRRASY